MGYWKTIDEADGWDTFHDTQVWVEEDEDGVEHETSRTRNKYTDRYNTPFNYHGDPSRRRDY